MNPPSLGTTLPPNPAVERDCAKARSPSLLRWATQSLGAFMQQLNRKILIVLMSLPATALADICPDNPPAVNHYSKTYSCPATTVSTEGEKYVDDSWDCFSLVPIKSESASYSSGKNKGALPSVNSLLPSTEKDFKNRTWMVSDVQCADKNKVTVLYWSGGNCKDCEHKVQYRFATDGKLEEAKLK